MTVLFTSQAISANRSWTGYSEDWSTPAKWGGTEPTSNDAAYIYSGRSANITQTGEVCSALYLGNTSNTASVRMSSGDLSVSTCIYVGYSGSGIFYQTGGTNSMSELSIGFQTKANGRYELSGTGSLGTSKEYVGYSGKGTFLQTGGLNFTYDFYLGCAAGSEGNFELNGGELQANYDEYIGLKGTGIFNHSAGTNLTGDLYVGSSWISGMAGGTGAYNLSGTGELTAGRECIGGDGHGMFNQSGGTNTTGSLNLDSNVAGQPTYTLSGGTLNAPEEYIAFQGTDAFAHSGGLNKTTYLYLGINSGMSTGKYDLSGTGVLTATYEYVGDGGIGIFTHSSGTNTTNCLYLGNRGEASGTYVLSGTGSLTTSYLYIGYTDIAGSFFQQTGGTNTAKEISVGPEARFQLDGGTLEINNGGLSSRGEIDCSNSTATLHATNSIVDLSRANLKNVGAMTVNMGDNSLLLLPADFDPSAKFGNFSSTGLYHNAGTMLVVPAGKGISGSGTINDPVDCQGTITVAGSTINFNGGIMISGSGRVDFGLRNLNINDPVSGMSGGTLSTGGHFIGYGGSGTFNQSGGTNTASNYIYLGYNAGDSGTYVLSGFGTLTTPRYEYVGYSGTGSFTQSGGNNSISQGLYLGYYSSGTYELANTGSLTANIETVGYYGIGSFCQSGGTNTITGGLVLADQIRSHGSYELSGGTLSAYYVMVGSLGEGFFTQTGGTFTITNSLFLSNSTSDDYGNTYIGKGTFNLKGGTLVLKSLAKGSSAGIAAFNFGGGTLRASGVFSTTLPITLTGEGGNANFDTAGYASTLAGSLSGIGGLNKLGNNTLTLSAANNFSGDTTIGGGTLTLAHAGALQGSTLDYNSYGGSLSFGTLAAATLGGLKGYQKLPLQRTNSAAVALSVGGNGQSTVFGGQLYGAGSLIKIGSGVLTLSGSNSYLGNTTVNAGTLNVANASGSATGTGTVIVNSGATLTGSGTISGQTTINSGGILAPGNGLGILMINNQMTLQPGAMFNAEVNGLTAGSEYDQLIASGPVSLAGSLNISFGTFAPTGNDVLFLISNNGTSATTGTFQYADDVKIGSFRGLDWYITYDANNAASPSLNGGNDVALYSVAVPEPTALALLATGLLCLSTIPWRNRSSRS
jgi:autotransporter-associated beta strand protein